MKTNFVKLEATYLGLERDKFTISFEVEKRNYMFEYYMILETFIEEERPDLTELDIDDFEIVIK